MARLSVPAFVWVSPCSLFPRNGSTASKPPSRDHQPNPVPVQVPSSLRLPIPRLITVPPCLALPCPSALPCGLALN